MNTAEVSTVSYKKGNWIRYTLWGLAALCIGLLIYVFIDTMNSEVSAHIPEGYKFAITENYNDNSNIRTSYYVYDDKILVEKESYDNNGLNRAMVMYDGVDTKKIDFDADADAGDCEETKSCKARTKTITAIRKLISHRAGREYVGL